MPILSHHFLLIGVHYEVVQDEATTFETIIEANPQVKKGGKWSPKNCKPWQKVALILCYRDRMWPLQLFLQRIHPMLQAQMLDYQIFLVEQVRIKTVDLNTSLCSTNLLIWQLSLLEFIWPLRRVGLFLNTFSIVLGGGFLFSFTSHNIHMYALNPSKPRFIVLLSRAISLLPLLVHFQMQFRK